MTRPGCQCGGVEPNLTEVAIMNYDALPSHMKGWRLFRIEYGFECSCPEGLIYLPASIDPDDVENAINGRLKSWKSL